MNLLLGDRASTEVVHAGAERTEVEGMFQFSASAAERLDLFACGEWPEGRHARSAGAGPRGAGQRPIGTLVNGRAVNSALLGEIGGLLVDVHGQGEHLSLLHEREHVGLLDRYAGLQAQVAKVADLARHVRALRRELDGLRQDEHDTPAASTC